MAVMATLFLACLLAFAVSGSGGYRMDMKAKLTNIKKKTGSGLSGSNLNGDAIATSAPWLVNSSQRLPSLITALADSQERSLVEEGSALAAKREQLSLSETLAKSKLLKSESIILPVNQWLSALTAPTNNTQWEFGRLTWVCIAIAQICIAGYVIWTQYWDAVGTPKKKEKEGAATSGGSSLPTGEESLSDRLATVIAQEEPTPLRLLAKEGLRLAVPTTFMAVLAILNEVASLVALGRVGTPVQLSAVGIANMLINCTYMSFGVGICNVQDTLVSQAFGAANNLLSCYYMQRCRVLATLQMVWIIPVLWFSDTILTLLGQEPEVALLASPYCRISIVTALAFFHTCSVLVFLKNRGDVLPTVFIFAAGNVAQILGCCIFILHLQWGTYGVGCATCLSGIVTFIASHVYLVFFSSARVYGLRTLLWVEQPGRNDLLKYISLAVPAVFSAATEFWYWEVNTLMAGWLGEAMLAAHVVANNFEAVCSVIVIGIGSATATMVGNAIGMGKPKKARKVAYYGLASTLVVWFFSAALIVLTRHYVARVYTNSSQVQGIMANLCLIIALAGFFNVAQASIGGALRGLGLQKSVAIVHLVSYYVVALTLGAFFAFGLGLGIYGIYWSTVVGMALSTLFVSLILVRVDWEGRVKEAAVRMEQEKKSLQILNANNWRSQSRASVARRQSQSQ